MTAIDTVYEIPNRTEPRSLRPNQWADLTKGLANLSLYQRIFFSQQSLVDNPSGVRPEHRIEARSNDEMYFLQGIQPRGVDLTLTFMGEVMAHIPGEQDIDTQTTAPGT